MATDTLFTVGLALQAQVEVGGDNILDLSYIETSGCAALTTVKARISINDVGALSAQSDPQDPSPIDPVEPKPVEFDPNRSNADMSKAQRANLRTPHANPIDD